MTYVNQLTPRQAHELIYSDIGKTVRVFGAEMNGVGSRLLAPAFYTGKLIKVSYGNGRLDEEGAQSLCILYLLADDGVTHEVRPI
jgi:hypothetical protein